MLTGEAPQTPQQLSQGAMAIAKQLLVLGHEFFDARDYAMAAAVYGHADELLGYAVAHRAAPGEPTPTSSPSAE